MPGSGGIDSKYEHKLIPNTRGYQCSPEFRTVYSINSLGLRDKEYSLKKPDNTYRIILTGDSFAEGWGVDLDDSVSKVLERMLNKNTKGLKYEVINGGIVGLSPILEYLWIKDKWLYLEPDCIILLLNFCDIQDDFNLERYATFDADDLPVSVMHKDLLDTSGRKKRIAINRFLKRNSAFYLFMRTHLKKLSKQMRGKETDNGIKNYFTEGDPHSDRFFMWRGSDVVIKDYWNRTARYLKGIGRICRKNDVELLIALMPMPQDVSGEEWAGGRAYWRFQKGHAYYPAQAMSTYEAFAKESGLRAVSLYKDFIQDKAAGPLHFSYDGHWNEKGHELAARALYRYMKDVHPL